jgi:hypothetical protein
VAHPTKHLPIGSDTADILTRGVAIVVATRDADLQPDLARGWGPDLGVGDGRIGLCVEAVLGSRTRANLERRSEVAMTATLPSTYRSVQLKGVVVEVDEPTPQQLLRAEQHHGLFAVDAAQVGIAPRLAPRFLDAAALVAVVFVLEELYDQTPGPAAGAAL